ncbi:short-chain dehydrogenase [Vibrio breoganii]|uniref:SDR family NAD(P)-dependent oxidoreductase n=1 Tax=Vibrio breoganii TaxID=553239 RepID=UPI000C82AFB6|nr:SDR family oxidoreductase [Vibrio breoganii]PMO91538.1 short-chain dehydrogenase [Vibrio breoganii]
MKSSIFKLDKMTVLITGATGYLGKEMCLGLGYAGAHVLVNSRDSAKANKLVAELHELEIEATAAVFDVSDETEVEAFFSSYNGELSVIVNNAYNGIGGTIEHSKSSDFDSAYFISVTSANNLFQRSLPLLRKSVIKHGYSSVINIASMYGCVSPNLELYATPQGSNPPFYGTAKAALIQWSKYGACEFGKEGIRFNSISPGPFPVKEKNSQEFLEQLAVRVPMARVGEAHELRGPVVFLASQASSYVNGANIHLDGGWTAW